MDPKQTAAQPSQSKPSVPPPSAPVQAPQPTTPPLVEARVRPGRHYGPSGPGEIVMVDPHELECCDTTLISVEEERKRDAVSKAKTEQERKADEFDSRREGQLKQWLHTREGMKRRAAQDAAEALATVAALSRPPA